MQKLGVGPDTAVGLSMERTPDLIVGMYAILKAGGAYLPLDPKYPSDRLAFMIEDSGVKLILTQSIFSPACPPEKRSSFASMPTGKRSQAKAPRP